MGKSRRGLSGRKPDTYDNETHGRSDTNSPPGDYTLNSGEVAVNLFRPRYEESPLIFRPFPMLDYERPTEMLQPSRKSPNPGGFTHWVVRVSAVSYAGSVDKKQVTFLLHHPADKDAKNNNPFRVLYYAAKQAHDNGRFSSNRKWDSDWNRLIVGKTGSSPMLDKPTHLYFCQGALLQNGEKIFMGERRTQPFGLAKGDDLCVIQMKSSAGRAMYAMLDWERESFEGDETEDPSLRFRYGNPTGYYMPKKGIIEEGNFIQIFNPKKFKVEGTTGRSLQAGDNDDMGKGYDAQILRQVTLNKKTYMPDLDAEATQQVFDKVCFWFDDPDSKEKGLLNIAPAEQQCLWIAQAYSNVPKLLQYAWAEHDEFFTDEVNGILRNRASASVPGDDDDDDRDNRRRPKDDDDAPPARGRRRDDDDDDAPPARSRRKDDDDDDDAPPARRQKDDDDDDAPPRRRSDPTQRGGKDDDDDAPPARRRRDDDDDDAPPARRQKDDEDDDAPPARRQKDDDDDDAPPARRRQKDDDDDDAPPARRQKDDEDDDAPPRRRQKDDDDDAPPARRQKDDDDDAPPARRRAKDDDDDDAPPARRQKDDDDDAPPPRRRSKDDDDDAPPARRRPKDDDRDDYFPDSKSDKDEFADDDKPARGRSSKDKDDELDKSSAAAKEARGNGGKRNAPPPKDAPAPKKEDKKPAPKKDDKKPTSRKK